MRGQRVEPHAWWLSVLVASLVGLASCGEEPRPEEGPVLLVVEASIYRALAPSLALYVESVSEQGLIVHVEPWLPGTVEELKTMLFEKVDELGIEGALLVGELPAAWYEQEAFNRREEFPTDLYLQDRDAIWEDDDEDGIFDRHSELNIEIYTSRLMGTVSELESYFDRSAYYHTVGSLVDVSALIFIDDHWTTQDGRGLFYLDELYSEVDVLDQIADTTLNAYLDRLTGQGAEFVYQWIHSTATFLKFYDLTEEGALTISLLRNLGQYDLQVSFLNMYDCSAARFTGPNLAQQYTLGSEHGLAIIGSTKTGAVTQSNIFHGHLVQGERWGPAYRRWYNEAGAYNDEWHLGVVIMGDPLLRVTGDLEPAGPTGTVAPCDETDEFRTVMELAARDANGGTFEEYRRAHPNFF